MGIKNLDFNLISAHNYELFFHLARLVKEFDRELKDLDYKIDSETSKMLNEKKQSMVRFHS